MKFLISVALLFLIYETTFYLVLGQSINEEKTDCTKLLNYLNGDSEDYGNKCCLNTSAIKCDEKYHIISFNNGSRRKFPDLKYFPKLSFIEDFQIFEVHFKEIPDNIMELTTLKSITLYDNKIEVIPPTIQKLSNLERIRIMDNYIKVLPNELFNLKNLNILNLSDNNIEEIPPAIQNLSKLEFIDLYNNQIKELPSEIFNLTNLKEIHIQKNENLKAKIIKFGNSTIENCSFDAKNILCYEPGTCKSLNLDGQIDIKEEDWEINKCTEEDIRIILSQKSINGDNDNDNDNDNNKNPNSLPIVIIVCVIVDLTGLVISYILIRKRKSKKRVNANTSFNDAFRTDKKDKLKFDSCIKITIVIVFITLISAGLTLLVKALFQN